MRIVLYFLLILSSCKLEKDVNIAGFDNPPSYAYSSHGYSWAVGDSCGNTEKSTGDTYTWCRERFASGVAKCNARPNPYSIGLAPNVYDCYCMMNAPKTGKWVLYPDIDCYGKESCMKNCSASCAKVCAIQVQSSPLFRRQVIGE